MHEPSNPNRVIRFGVFEVDLQEAELRQSGSRQKLSPQAFEVLRAMLERPGGSSPEKSSESVYGPEIQRSTTNST
jgi:DNA-binding response OmpR family regulator